MELTSLIEMDPMNKLLISICISVLTAVLLAQSKKVKIYAYQQQVIPGLRQTTIDETGTVKETPPKMSANSFIYLQIPPGKNVDAKHVWVNGKLYDVKTASVPSLPVVMYNTTIAGKKPDTLVHATSNKVIQISLVPASETFNPSSKVKKKIKSNELVLHTIESGKNCYYYVDHVKRLDPVALQ